MNARWATTMVFGINGMLIASLAVRTPSLKQDLHLSSGQLGVILALFGLAAVVMMQMTGTLATRFGSRSIIRVTTVVLPMLLVGTGLVPSFAGQAALAVAFGAADGMLNVSMNAHAVTVERAMGRPIMNGCHAAWSIASVGGALLASGAAHIGMNRTEHFLVIAAVLIPAALFAGRSLLPADPDGAVQRSRIAWRTGWTRQVFIFGAMGATVLTAEVAIADWSGVFLHENRHASLGAAGLGYVAFAICQTSGRLVGDRIQARTSAVRLLRTGALLAAAGLTVVVLSPWAWLGIAGFALMGLGLATSLPVLYGAVGHLGAQHLGAQGDSGADVGASVMVARFTTMTYAGILFAPAAIGWVAELIGLTLTLGLLIPLLLAVAVSARLAHQTGASVEDEPEKVAVAPAA